MRLIDADALSAKMYHDAFETDSDMQKWDSGCWIRYKMFEKNLEDAPTIERPERKRGRWINAYPDMEPNPMFMYGICSECGFEQSISNKLNYCPNCGHPMGGESE